MHNAHVCCSDVSPSMFLNQMDGAQPPVVCKMYFAVALQSAAQQVLSVYTVTDKLLTLRNLPILTSTQILSLHYTETERTAFEVDTSGQTMKIRAGNL